MKTVCLDLGNTRMKAALFENGELKESHVLEADGFEKIKEIKTHLGPVLNLPEEYLETN